MTASHNLVSRETAVSVLTPVIPLNFVYPGLSLAQILSIVKAYRKPALLIVLAVLALTALIMAVWPRTYTAMVTLMVNYEVNDPLNGKELPVGQVGSYIATQVELMQTPEVVLAVVDRLKLTQNKDYAQGYRGDSGTLREWVAKKVSKDLVIYQGQMGSQLIYVTYASNDPAEAAQVANTVAEV
ncbi:MAG: Wzz/FepE/Etk N-terminal domain-containing protein, partial [Sulfuricaulis sp.]|nr:Wzz/FepE/Etk N-terminal domain-containing protein [Sulfuricaulis sp.]